jgi:hypothetical protein
MDYGLDDRGSIPGKRKDFSLLHNVHTGSEAHPAPYKIGTEGSLMTSHLRLVPKSRMVVIPPLPHTPNGMMLS